MNQVPVSDARWRHGSWICFATYFAKNHRIVNNLTAAEGKEKMSIDLESLEFLKKVELD
jgi:hypothetical protein